MYVYLYVHVQMERFPLTHKHTYAHTQFVTHLLKATLKKIQFVPSLQTAEIRQLNNRQ